MKTSQHEIRARYETWAIATILCVAIGAVAAHIDGKQDADNKAVRAHVEQQRVGEQGKVECVLAKVGDKCTIKF